MFFLLCSATVFAQDVIVKKDGSTVLCRVVNLTSTEIVYKKWSDLEGSNYVMDRSLVSAINYQDGKKENLSEITENLYAPGIQNDGLRQINDKALLDLDANINKGMIKVKNLKRTAWIGGLALFTAGAVLCAVFYPSTDKWIEYVDYNTGYYDSMTGTTFYNSHYKKAHEETFLIVGIPLAGAGVIWTVAFLSAAHSAQKKAGLNNISLYQHDFNMGNSSTLSVGVDVLKDNLSQKQTLGLGLHLTL